MERFAVLGTQPFTRADAERQGIGRAALDRALASGRVRRVHRGAFVRAHVPDTPELRVRAARLLVSFTASHESAAAVLGLDVEPPRDPRKAEDEHVVRGTVPPGTRPSRLPGLRLTAAGLTAAETARVHGLTVTSGTRTAVDLASERDLVEAVVVLDAVLRAGLTDRVALAEAVVRRRGRRGVVTARAALAHADPRAESPMETRLRMLLVLAGLPAPVPQHVVRHPDGRALARVDLAYVEQRLAIEYDGRAAHLEPGRFLHDRHRHHDLREAGWEVLRFTGEDVGRGRAATADRVRRTLARLSPAPVARAGGVVVPRW